MANMTFSQSVAEGRKQGGVSPQKARENYEKMNRQINQSAVQPTTQPLPVKETTPAETQTAMFTKKAEKKPVQDDTQERMSYLRSMNLDEARANLADLEDRLSGSRKAGDAFLGNLAQINRFMPGSVAYQELMKESEELRQRKNQLQQDIADADYVQTYDRYSALKSARDYASNLERTGIEPWRLNQSIAWATPDEYDTFYYIRNTQGDQAAVDYMDFMSDVWNQRSGQEDARQISNVKNPVARALATAGYGLFSGLDQYASGVKQTAENIFGDGKRIPTSSLQYGSSDIRQNLGKAGKIGYDVVTTTANMIPTITAAAMTGGAGALTGAASMGVSVYGNTYNQAIQQGYSPKQANSYALISAASETALQYALGGISKLGGVATNSVVQKSVQNIRSAAGRAAAELGLRMGGEFTEEYLQEVLDPVFRNMMLDEDNKVHIVSEEAAYAGILGALSAGMFEGGGAIQTARGGSNVQTSVEESQAPAVTDTAQSVEKPVRYTLPTKPEQTALDKVKSEYRNTGVITNRAAESILADPQALAELGIQPTGTKSQQRTAVKDAISAEVTPRAQGLPLVDRTSEEQTVPVDNIPAEAPQNAPDSIAFEDNPLSMNVPVENQDSSTLLPIQFFSGESDTPDIAPTQSRSRDQVLTPEDISAMPGVNETTHEVIHETDSMQSASRFLEDLSIVENTDPAGAQRMLENRMHDLATNETWTPAENDLAFMIRDRMLERARETGDYNAEYGGYTLPQWLRLIDDMGTAEGQALQARRKWSVSDRDSIVSEVEKTISKKTDLSDGEKSDVIKQVDDFLGEIEDAAGVKLNRERMTSDEPAQDTPEVRGNLIDVIERIAQSRGITKTVLTGSQKNLSKIIRNMLNGFDADTLTDMATRSALAIANDRVATNRGDRLKTLQVLSHLFNPRTWTRNIVGNASFGAVDTASTAMGTFFDILVGKATGTRSVSVTSNLFGSDTWSAKMNAFYQSVTAIYLDVDMTGDTNRYGQKKSRTFRMNETKHGALNRVLSKLERNLSYALTSTDQFSKGGIQATQTSRIQQMIDEGKIDVSRLGVDVSPDEYAAYRGTDLARYRTFQDNSKLAAGAKTVHDVLNLAGVGSTGRTVNGHEVKAFGVGDLLMPYPGVPGNIASRAVEYSPVAFARGVIDIGKVLKSGKSATVSDQAKAVMELSRGISGSTMIGLAAFLAANGVIRSAEDDDKEDQDKKRLNKSEGLTGIQFNLSAMIRSLTDEPTEWQQGDRLASLDFLQPINSWLALGCFLDSYLSGDQDYDAFTASVDAFGRSIEDFPVLQTLQNIVDDVRYSDVGLTSAIIQESTSSAISSFVPSFVRNIATATDDVQRDAYSGKFGAVSLYDWISQTSGLKAEFLSALADFLDGTMKLSESVSTVMSSIPGLRQMLPQKLDNYGSPMGYTGSRALNAANALLLPGAVDTYRQRDVSKELASVSNEVGTSNFYPNRLPVSSVSYHNQKYSLNYDQRQEYQKNYGMLYYSMASDLISSQTYQDADAATRADMFSELESIASDQARMSFMESIGVDYSDSDAAKLIQKLNTLTGAGIDFPQYYSIKNGVSKIDNGNSDTKTADKLNLLNNSGLDIQQQAVYYYTMVSTMGEKKIQDAKQAGIDKDTLYLWSYRFKMLDELSGARNEEKRNLLFSSSSLSAKEKESLDDILLSDVIVIPKDLSVEYSSEDSFYISQMSDAGQKRYKYFVQGQISGEEWNRIYSTYSDMKKEEVIAGLMEEGWNRSDAATIYNWIKPTKSMKESAGWE